MIISKPSKYHFSQHSSSYDSRTGATTIDINNASEVSFATGSTLKDTSSDPSWRVKIAKRQNASQHYKLIAATCSPARVQCNTLVRQPTYYQRGQNLLCWMGDAPTSFVTTDPTVSDQALTRFKRKLASHSGAYNGLLPLAELRDLRSTISQAANLTETLLKTLLDIKRTRGASAFRYAADAWLGYNFGIAPTIADAQQAAKAVSEFLLRQDHTVRLSSGASRTWITGRKSAGNSGTVGASVSNHAYEENTISYRYTGGFNFTLRSSNDYSAIDHFGLKLPSLIPTAWALVPFSWVFDYFGTVGAYLDDVFIATPGNLQYLNVTRKFQSIGKVRVWHVPDAGVSITQREDTGTQEYTEFERTPLTALPHRILRLKTADEVGLYGINKILNLASILIK